MRNRIKNILREENEEFDWIKDQNPVTKEIIMTHLNSYQDYGYYARENDKLVDALYLAALPIEELIPITKSLDNAFAHVHQRGTEEGANDGWYEGHQEGYNEAESDYEDEQGKWEDKVNDLELEADERYHEGYDEGKEDGYTKGFEEGKEAMYHKAFEEGRAYESGKDAEYYERGESDFNFGDDEELD